jgi:hypothetical protein
MGWCQYAANALRIPESSGNVGKMYETVPVRISCPYCGETIEVVVDTSLEQQDYIEDCSVCCRPMRLTVTIWDDQIVVDARDENEV